MRLQFLRAEKSEVRKAKVIGVLVLIALYVVSWADAGNAQQTKKQAPSDASATAEAQGHADQALAYENHKRYADAIREYTAAIDHGDASTVTLRRRGMLLARLGMIDAGIADLTLAISRSPKEYDLYENRGGIYVSSNQEKLAIKDFCRALEVKPGDRTASTALADLYDSTLQYSLAIKHLNFIIGHPDWASWDMYRRRGTCFLKGNKPAEAVADFSKVLVLKPQARTVHESRCDAYTMLKNYKAAIADCTLAIKETVLSGYLYQKRAKLYRLLGENELAAKDDAEALKQSQDLFDDAPFRVKQKQHK